MNDKIDYSKKTYYIVIKMALLMLAILLTILIIIFYSFEGKALESNTITIGHAPQYTWDGIQITELSNISEIEGGYSINWRGMIYNISILNGYDTFAYPNGTFVSANIFPHINRWQTPQKKWVEIIPSSRTISRNGNDIYLNMTMFEGGLFNITYTITDRIKYTWDFTSGTNYNYSIDFQIHGAAGIDVNSITKKYTPTWFNNFPIYDWTDIQEPYASNVSTSIDVNNKIMYQRIILGQMSVGSRIVIDPTIKLQIADIENLGDSYVTTWNPNGNYGSVNTFSVGGVGFPEYYSRGYITFNLSLLPDNIIINNSELFLCGTTSSSFNVYAYEVISNWSESGITWNNQPCYTGCNLSYESSSVVSSGWNWWNVTNMISNSTINNRGVISIMLTSVETGAVPDFIINSKEYLDNILLRPYLNVTYTQLTGDNTPPTYSGTAHNQTTAGLSTLFSIQYNDETALQSNGRYIFSTNNTGTWVNDSAVNWTATPQWANVTKTLNSTADTVIGYRWYANDSAGNTNNTPIYTLIVTSVTDTSFTVSLPNGQIQAFFNATNKSSVNVNASGQNTSAGFLYITNTGNVALNFYAFINASQPTGVTLKSDINNDPTGSITITTSSTQIISALGTSSSQYIWLWVDYSNALPMSEQRNLSVNSSQI